MRRATFWMSIQPGLKGAEMSIRIGTQLIAPAGFHALEKGQTYYFLRSDSAMQRVLLVQFILRQPTQVHRKDGIRNVTQEPAPILSTLGREHFEDAILNGKIVAAPKQSSMPPWLEPLAGINLAMIDECRPQSKMSHSDRIDRKLLHIYPLVQLADDVFRREDPERFINQYARQCTPPQKESRIRLWLYSYLLFGRNRFALHYPIHRIGHWDRKEAKCVKLGAPSPYRGKEHGTNVNNAMKQKIHDGYLRFASLGTPMTQIYQSTMRKIFDCIVRPDSTNRFRFIHPNGEPLPTFNQFVYHVKKEFGQQQVQQNLIGRMRARNEVYPSAGRFTESVANLLEKAESDGYYFEEVPKGFVDGHPLPLLCMVRMRDVTSGAIVGIGFSQNAERASAYRSTLFCAAIDKVKFCRLFGIEIQAEEWPMIGISPFHITDRGPGAASDAVAREIVFRPLMHELAPSNSGQSKATIESSHPKTVSNKESPSHWQSNLTPLDMARREIFRVLKDNDTMDISSRLTPDLVGRIRKPSPISLWNILDTVGRNDGIHMSFNDAVRNYLKKVPVKAKSDGIYLHGQRYDSGALRSTDLLQRISKAQSVELSAYLLEACLRHIWIEVNGEVVELDMQLALRTGTDVTHISLDQLVEMERLRREDNHFFKEHCLAKACEVEQRFAAITGQEWNSGSRRKGRPKRGTSSARQEAREADGILHGKKIA